VFQREPFAKALEDSHLRSQHIAFVDCSDGRLASCSTRSIASLMKTRAASIIILLVASPLAEAAFCARSKHDSIA